MSLSSRPARISLPPSRSTIGVVRVKECFICKEIQREDAAEFSPRDWVRPCRCRLEAHQSCLVEQLTKTTPGKRRSSPSNASCPQCKHRYRLQYRLPLSIVTLLFRSGEILVETASTVFFGASFISLCGLGCGVVYCSLTAYGAYSSKLVFGEELFNFLMTDDPVNWPLLSYLILPFAPIRLMSRHHNNFASLSSLFLMWPSLPPVPIRENLIDDTRLTSRTPSFSPRSRIWPPTLPKLGVFILLMSTVYDKLFSRFSYWLLGVQPPPRRMGRRRPRFALLRQLMRLGRDNPPNPENNRPPAEGADEEAAHQNRGFEAIENATHYQDVSIFNSLAIPFIAKGIGYLLYRCSMYSSSLRFVLGMRPSVTNPPKLVPDLLGSVHNVWYWRWFTDQSIDNMDPVWVRNTIGLGIYIVGRDCLHLFHLWLAKRELASRRLKNRDFSGVDPSQLDLIPRD